MIDTSLFSRFEFHDLPVSGVEITTEPYLAVTIGICPFNEQLQEYDYFKLYFTGVETLYLDEINLVAKADLEIFGCDYEVKENLLQVEFTLLAGFRQQSCLMKITSSGVRLEQYFPEN